MAGRKPKHAFNTLEIGQKAELTGKAKKYAKQFIYQLKKNTGKELVRTEVGAKVFVQRVA